MDILCDIYLRLSDIRSENGSFVEREKAVRAKASQLGWKVRRVVIENDETKGSKKSASAFKRRKVKLADGTVVMRVWRPGFRSALEDIAAGRIQGLLAEDLDRVIRDPRDGEDLIDVMQARKAWADSISGSLRFTAGGTDSEITMARLMVAIAWKSSRDTARRVTEGRERKAAKGEFGGGPRPFGFGVQVGTNEDGKAILDYGQQVPEEAAEIRKAADQILADIPLKAVARDLMQRGVPTVTGTRWTSQTLRAILLRPRNAGIVVHGGEETTARYPGSPILEVDVFRAVAAKLGARTAPGRAAIMLGSNIYRCCCGSRMEKQCGTVKAPAYRCAREGGQGEIHVRRNAKHLDSFITDLVVARLSKPDAVTLFVRPNSGIDVKALRREADALKELRLEIMRDRDEGLIDRAEMAVRLRRNQAKVEAIESQLASATDRSPLDGVAGAKDVAATWGTLSLGQQRAIVNLLMTVTVLPAKRRGGPGFDPDAVQVAWRR